MNRGYGEVWRDNRDDEIVMVIRVAELSTDDPGEYLSLILVESDGRAGATRRAAGDLALVDLKWPSWERLDDAE